MEHTDLADVSVPRGSIPAVPRWGPDAPFVGRTVELDRLVDRLAAAHRGEPSAGVLGGDAGVGKTRLLAEVARRAEAEHMVVVVGHCVDLGDVGLPYLPFTEILRGIAKAVDDPGLTQRYPALSPLLGGSPEVGAESTDGLGRQLQLFDSVAALLTELSSSTPLFVLIEDLHWADQSTRDLFRFLVSRLAEQRLLILGSYRTDDLHRRHPLRPMLAELARLQHAFRLQLDPLADAEVASLLRSLHGPGLTPGDLARIVDIAEGNAFYAEQLLEANSEQPGDALPDALADILLVRLEQLVSAAQQVVRIAAVAGRRVQHGVLREATGLPDVDLEEALREAVARHVLVPRDDQTYSFAHALLREAVYADLLPGERVRLHALFASLLARGATWAGSAAELAYHRRESHDLAGALTAALDAAQEARHLCAPAEQLRHLQSALELWPSVADAAELTGRDEVSLMLSAASAAAQAGESHRAVALTRSALERVDSPSDLELTARVRYTLAQNLVTLDLDQAAYAETSAALALLPVEPPSAARTWAAATHVRTASYVGDQVGARQAAAEAMAAAEVLGLDAAWADAAISIARMNERCADADQVTVALTEAYERARRSGDGDVELRATYGLAVVRYEVGDLTGALRWLAGGIERSTSRGWTWSPYAAEIRHLQVVVRYVAGDWDGSLRSADLRGLSAPKSAQHVATAGLFVAVGRGAPDVARQVAEAMLTSRDHPLAMLTAGSCAIDLASWTGAELAEQALADTIEAVGRVWGRDFLGFVRLLTLALGARADRASAARLVGDADSAAQHVDACSQLVQRVRDIAAGSAARSRPLGVEALAWLARADGEWSRARGVPDPAAWHRAVAAFADHGHVYEQARSRWRWAEALLALDERGAAAGEARAAHDVALGLGAGPLLAAVEALVRRGRLDAGLPERVGAAPASPLTARENDVLALLSQGRTNAQIGRELYISAKTASVHVSNIVAKLGASGRTEAVAIAYRRGLVAQP